MTILPPSLLLEGNTIVIDSTGLETFKICPTKFLREQVDRRVLAGVKPAIVFGKAIHGALEMRHKLLGNKAVVGGHEAMHGMITTSYTGIEIPLDEPRNEQRAHEVIDAYNATYGAEPFEVLAVEAPFAVPVGRVYDYNVVWQGRVDLLIRSYDDNNIYVLDHKTMQSWGKNTANQFDNSAQFKGYAWAMQESYRLYGFPFPERVAGFMLNAIVVRKPYANGSTTTPTRASASSQPRNEFRRNRCFYSQERLAEWRVDMLVWVRQMLDCAERGEWPMNTRHCDDFYNGSCPMKEVCTAPPAQRAMILASDNYQDNDWSPLEREGQP